MKVFLKKDLEHVGLAGEIIKVTEGYARNFLIPRGLALEINKGNAEAFKVRERSVENRKEVIATETSMLAEKIRSIDLVLKKKMHDDGKLYGALNAADVASKLAEKGVSVSKSQVIFDKSIKEKGSYEVTIKLSSRLKPRIRVNVVAE